MQIEEGYRMNAEVDNFFRLSDPDCVPLENREFKLHVYGKRQTSDSS